MCLGPTLRSAARPTSKKHTISATAPSTIEITLLPTMSSARPHLHPHLQLLEDGTTHYEPTILTCFTSTHSLSLSCISSLQHYCAALKWVPSLALWGGAGAGAVTLFLSSVPLFKKDVLIKLPGVGFMPPF